MQLHEFRKLYKEKTKKRVGRGGKRGTTSGRGQKGQKSRAGRRLRPAQRDLILRLPKRRGFRNKPKASKPVAFNLSTLSLKIKSYGEKSLEIDKNFLKGVGLLPVDYRGEVKILGDGEIKSPVVIKGLRVSKGAKMKIEKAGGKVNESL